MERLWRAAFAAGGVAAIGFFVFWSLYKQWLSLPIFSQLSQDQTFIIMLVFLLVTFLSLISAFVLHAYQKRHVDDIFPMYEELRKGLASPEENILLIERMANSTDPRKEERLRTAGGIVNLSFAEAAAINLALDDIRNKRHVTELKERVREAELRKIDAMIPDSNDPLFEPIFKASKYWRFVNRKDHPNYRKMKDFIAIITVNAGFNDEARALSRELTSELQ